MRKGALKSIKISQVDLKAGVVQPSQHAGRKKVGRGLPIYEDLAPWLEMALAEHKLKYPDCPWLFHESGKPIGLFRKSWATATKTADVPGLLFHDLRRTAVVNMDPCWGSPDGHQRDHRP